VVEKYHKQAGWAEPAGEIKQKFKPEEKAAAGAGHAGQAWTEKLSAVG